MYRGLAFFLGHAKRLDYLTGLLVNDLDTLLCDRLGMLGLVGPHVIRLGMGADKYSGAIGVDRVAYLPGCVLVTFRIIAPDGYLTFAEVRGATDRSTGWIVPV